MMIIVGAYLGLCLLIALIGKRRKFGFWGYFFCSLFLTPIIGTIVMLGSDERPEETERYPQ